MDMDMDKGMKRFFWSLPIAALFLCWFAQGAMAEPYWHAPTLLVFPDRLAGLEKKEVHDFESSLPGLGVSVAYVASGMKVNLYLYTQGRKEIPANLGLPEIIDHFAQIVADVTRAVAAGAYESVQKTAEGKIPMDPMDPPGAGQREALSAKFDIVQGGQALRSRLYLTVFKGHFLKIRVTYDDKNTNLHEGQLNQLLGELATMLRGP